MKMLYTHLSYSRPWFDIHIGDDVRVRFFWSARFWDVGRRSKVTSMLLCHPAECPDTGSSSRESAKNFSKIHDACAGTMFAPLKYYNLKRICRPTRAAFCAQIPSFSLSWHQRWSIGDKF